MLDELGEALVNFDVDRVTDLVRRDLSAGKDPMDILGSLRSGLDEVGKKFEGKEFFVTDLVMAGELMSRSLTILKPYLKTAGGEKGKIVLGTIIGDLHDIGKNIAKSLLISAGFNVFDIGIDKPPETFVEKVQETGARIIGISALLSTSIVNTAQVIQALKEAGIRDQVKVIVGGAPARSWMIEEYGVDAAVIDIITGLAIIKKWASNELA